MDQESNQMEQHPVQCRNGCGFYSNAGTDGLCSVCYKDMIKKKQQPPTNMPASLAPSHAAMAQSPTSSSNINSSPEPVVGASCSSAGSINSSPIKPAQSWETASPTVQLPHTDKVSQRDAFHIFKFSRPRLANFPGSPVVAFQPPIAQLSTLRSLEWRALDLKPRDGGQQAQGSGHFAEFGEWEHGDSIDIGAEMLVIHFLTNCLF